MVSEVKLLIGLASEPPELFIDGFKYKVNAIEYNYETANAYDSGRHNLIIKYIDSNSSDAQITIAGFER